MNRVWSVIAKVLGGVLVFGGGTVTIGILAGMIVGQVAGGWLSLLTIVLVVFGLAPVLMGAWFWWLGSRAEQQSLRDCFFNLVRLNQGRISLLNFAATARLEPAIARQKLDQWARDCSANFEVSESGDIYYIFAMDSLCFEDSAFDPQPGKAIVNQIKQVVRRLESGI